MFLLDRLHLTEDSICPITFLSKISFHSSPSEKKTNTHRDEKSQNDLLLPRTVRGRA